MGHERSTAARFPTPESWSVGLRGRHGTEAQNLLRPQAIKNP